MKRSEENVIAALAQARIVPVIAIENAEDAVALCGALKAGGLNVAEITFRTAAAAEALTAAATAYPDFLIGAGTVTRIDELERAAAAGASFAVAPGTNPVILQRASEVGIPFFPGVCSPSDIELALQHDRTFLKFFPAEAAGGLKMLSALHGPYAHRGVRFMPTGGVTLENLRDYLAHPSVVAIGGTWLVAKPLLEKRNWSAVENLAREAVAIAEKVGH